MLRNAMKVQGQRARRAAKAAPMATEGRKRIVVPVDLPAGRSSVRPDFQDFGRRLARVLADREDPPGLATMMIVPVRVVMIVATTTVLRRARVASDGPKLK
jgi:hypothetical protein